jgi:hypothetical protein
MEALGSWFSVLDKYTLTDAISGSRRIKRLLQIPA